MKSNKQWKPVSDCGQLWHDGVGYAVVSQNKPFVLSDTFPNTERVYTFRDYEIVGTKEIIYLG